MAQLRQKYEKRLESVRGEYSEKMSKMNEAVTKLSRAREKLQQEISVLKEQLKQAKNETNAAKEERQNAEQQLRSVSRDGNEVKSENLLLRESVATKSSQLHRLEGNLMDLERTLHELSASQKVMENERNMFSTKLSALENQYQQVCEQKEKSEFTKNEIETRMHGKNDEIAKLSHQVRELKSKQSQIIHDCQMKLESIVEQKQSVQQGLGN